MINEDDKIMDILNTYPAVQKFLSIYGFNCYG